MFTSTLLAFLLLFIRQFVFLSFSFFDEVPNFRSRLLTNQKPEWVIRNCQWNCIYNFNPRKIDPLWCIVDALKILTPTKSTISSQINTIKVWFNTINTIKVWLFYFFDWFSLILTLILTPVPNSGGKVGCNSRGVVW